jgi:hypothetical protein
LGHERDAQVVVRLGTVWAEAEGLSGSAYGVLMAPQGVIHCAEIPPQDFETRLHVNGPANLFEGRLVPAFLVIYQAQEVQGIGVQGVDSEDFLIYLFSFP